MTKPWKSHRELITRFFIVSRKSIKSTSVRFPVIIRILLQFPPKVLNRGKNFLIMEIPKNFSPTKTFRTILHSKTVSSPFTGSLLICQLNGKTELMSPGKLKNMDSMSWSAIGAEFLIIGVIIINVIRRGISGCRS